MANRPMWMVRADEGGKLFEEFKANSIVGIGWSDMGDMASLRTRDEFAQAVAKAWPDLRRMQVAVSAGQAFRFVREMKVGDRVVTYDPSTRSYLVGTITSDYTYAAGRHTFPNIRSVKWDGTVARDSLSVSTRNSLGAISTLFLVPAEAAEEIERLLKAPQQAAVVPPKEEEETQVEAIFKDSQRRALEFTKDRISRLDWEEMQELVAGLLRAMGYKTQVSPSGADRGKDIVASPDGFGFASPRIIVEVKHRTGSAMGAQDIRTFLGGRHKDDRGLYVSSGGFSKEARYEAERASIPLTLMDLDDLVRAVVDHYEGMDTEAKRLIPLRKVYWPG